MPSRKTIEKSPPSTVPQGDFWQTKTLDQMAADQGVPLPGDGTELLGDFWPAKETCDQFIDWLRKTRREGLPE